jgi:hypothetical protein
MGANNQPFFQNAMAQNISETVVHLHGIEPELKVGDVIGVQWLGKRPARVARCRCRSACEDPEGQLVADQDCPWALALRRI